MALSWCSWLFSSHQETSCLRLWAWLLCKRWVQGSIAVLLRSLVSPSHLMKTTPAVLRKATAVPITANWCAQTFFRATQNARNTFFHRQTVRTACRANIRGLTTRSISILPRASANAPLRCQDWTDGQEEAMPQVTLTALLLLALATGVVVHAVPASTGQETASGLRTIEVRVVDSATGRPIGGAVVRVLASGHVLERQTGPTGVVVLGPVPVSTAVSVSASMSGYEQGRYGQGFPGDSAPLPVEFNGRNWVSVDVRLWRRGVLGGRVLDERGRPVVDAPVLAFKETVVGGESRLVPSASTRTDRYGNYLMEVTPKYRHAVAAVSERAGSAQGRGRPQAAWPTGSAVFWPGDPRPSGSALLEVREGESRLGLDIVLPKVESPPLEGQLLAEPCPAALKLELYPLGAMVVDLPSAMTTAKSDCSFRFEAVPDGDYELRAIRFAASRVRQTGLGSLAGLRLDREEAGMTPRVPPPESLETRFVLHRVSLWGRRQALHVPLERGASVKGRILFEPEDLAPSEDTFGRDLLLLSTPDTSLFGLPATHVGPSGEFVTAELPPGRYSLQVFSLGNWKGWSVDRIVVNGRNVLGSQIDMGRTAVEGVQVVMSRQPEAGTLRGIVRTAIGNPARLATVYVFPMNRRYWNDSQSGPPFRLNSYRTDDRGYFATGRIIPGDYFVVASTSAGPNWQVLDTLTRWAVSAKSVTVLNRGSHVIDLTASDLWALVR